MSGLTKPRAVLCQHCYRTTMRRVSGGGSDAGRFCDRKCAAQHRAHVAREVAGIRAMAGPLPVHDTGPVLRQLVRTLRRLIRQREHGATLAALASSPCAVCGQPCGYTFGRRKRYCSRECQKASDSYRDHRCAHRIKRKALKRSVSVETVSPILVFDRDRWTCQLCGVATPKGRRGTMTPNAPELDHILPLACGGAHSYANTQCACRACNAAKGATPRGQLLLIG